MSKFEVINVRSAHSFGVFEAETADEAIDACCREAGYDSKAQMEETLERECEMTAVKVQ